MVRWMWLVLLSTSWPILGRAAEPLPPRDQTAQPALTLQAAFERAVRQHPSLQQAAARVDSAEALVGVARNGWLPTATVDLQRSELTGNRPPRAGTAPSVFNAATRPVSYEINGYWRGQIEGKWTVFDFGKTSAQVTAARQTVAAAEADVRTAKLQLWWNVATAYLGAMAAESGLKVFQLAVDQLTRTRDVTQQRVDAKVRTDVDLFKAEADLAGAQGDLLRAEEAVRSARVQLGATMGDTHEALGPLRTPILPLTALPGDSAPGDSAPDDRAPDDAQLDEMVRSAVQNRPEYAALRARIAAQQAAVQAAQRVIRPNVYVSAQGTAAGLTLDGLFYNVLMVAGVSFPLTSTWQQSPLIADARAQVRALQASEATQILTLRTALNQAVTVLVQARKRVTPAAAQVRFAQAARDAAQKRYDAGMGLMIELSDAQTAVVRAQLAQVQVELDIAQATAQLLWAVGRVP
jgi:outer membrane protein